MILYSNITFEYAKWDIMYDYSKNVIDDQTFLLLYIKSIHWLVVIISAKYFIEFCVLFFQAANDNGSKISSYSLEYDRVSYGSSACSDI